MPAVNSLSTPCFLVDAARLEGNCKRMLDVASELGVKLRPHVKTHKTREAAVLQTGGSCRSVVCSTIPEIQTLSGFDDILYGVPLLPEKLPRLDTLRQKVPVLHVMLDNPSTLAAVEEYHSTAGTRKWSVYVKINTGSNRAGLQWDSSDAIDFAINVATGPATTLAGLYVHDGHLSYGGHPEKVRQVSSTSIDKLLSVVEKLKTRGVTDFEFGIGCTPSCSNPVDKMSQLNEIHPGNYAFYDAQQLSYSNCSEDDIACTVLTTVVGHYPERNDLLIDAGFTATTKQGEGKLASGHVMFRGNPNLRLRGQTQELGIVTTIDGSAIDFDKYPIGAKLEIYPYHSCATAAMFGEYQIRDGNEVVDIWKPAKYW